MGWVSIAGWLLHVNALAVSQLTVYVGTLDIDLVQLEVLSCGEGENSVDGCQFGDRGICVEVVDAGYL